MKKLALSLIFCTFGTLFICSQEIFVKNGFTLSRMCAKIPILDKNITNYTILVGGDYEISSEIGYLVKGGQDEISTVSGYENISKTIPFVQLGTTFRAKLSNQNNAFFVGVGPRVDISLNGGNSIDYYMAQYNMNRCVVGVKAEAGAKTYFNKIGFGFSTQYSFDINPMLYADNIALRNSCFIFTLSVGYRLK